MRELNPDNSNLQGESKKVRVMEGKISKKMTWRGIKKGSSLIAGGSSY